MNDKPDLLAVLREYGIEARDGRVEQLIKCPNPEHPESHPSCTLNLIKGLFSCKACGYAGDSYTLIQTLEGTDFAGAVRISQERFGCAPTRVPARGGRKGLSGTASPARGGYRPKFGRRPGLRGSSG